MIIIKIIILYFIQIRHTDDFPSTGTRLVVVISRGCYITAGISRLALGVDICLDNLAKDQYFL